MYIKRYTNTVGEDISVPVSKPSNNFFDVSLYGITHPSPKYYLYHNPHLSHVFEYVISGKGHIEYGDRHITVEAGDFYFLRHGFVGRYYADPDDPYEKIWVNASGIMIDRIADLYGLTDPVAVYRGGTEPEGLIRDIHRIFDEGEERDLNEVLRLASEKAFEMLSLALGKQVFESSYFTPSFSAKVRQYIETSLYEAPTLEKLSERFHMNPSYLIRRFKNETGMTPIRYYNTCRIKAAMSMLEDGYTSKEVALILNYSDTAYFSKCFKDETGSSPSEYAKRPGTMGKSGQKSADIGYEG